MWPEFVPADDINLLKSYSPDAINSAFDYIAGSSQIDFNYRQGGCQQRAQLMSMILQKKLSIEHSKIWLFAPAALYTGDIRAMFVEDENELSPFNIVSWNYHVAPAVLIAENEQVNIYVIDPSVNKTGAVNLNTWFNNIGNSGVCKYSFHKPESYFFNSLYNKDGALTTIFDGSFIQFINPDKDNLVMEKGLAVNDTAMAVYHKYIKGFAAENDADKQKLEDLEGVFGNAAVLDMLFSQNLSGYSDNTSHRYLITNYTDIILDAKRIFNERLVFWTKYVNTLL